MCPSDFSGYRINYDKLEALPLGDFVDDIALANFRFKWSARGLIYLGVKMTSNLNNLFKLNVSPIIASIKNDLTQWFDLHLSWLGRVNVIKMNILTSILYPLQMVPLRPCNFVLKYR